MNVVAEKEYEVTINGNTYVTKIISEPRENGSWCNNCSFDDPNNDCLRHHEILLDFCCRIKNQDGKSRIWVEKIIDL